MAADTFPRKWLALGRHARTAELVRLTQPDYVRPMLVEGFKIEH